jgi:predicted RecA/RadA family phage recombinase
MAKNFIQPGKTITLTAPYARNSGQAAKIGSIIAISLATLANAASGEWATEGVWDVDKTSAEAWAVGDLVYWDNTAKSFTTTATSNTKAGVAVAVAANPSSTGRIRLNGAF